MVSMLSMNNGTLFTLADSTKLKCFLLNKVALSLGQPLFDTLVLSRDFSIKGEMYQPAKKNVLADI